MQSNLILNSATTIFNNKKSAKFNPCLRETNCLNFANNNIDNNHLSIKKRIKKENFSGLKLYHLQGKTQHQVQRRNERERRRVQQVNKGYEDLAQRVCIFKKNIVSKIKKIKLSF